METLQDVIFIEFDVNTKKITFLRKDNIIDYDSNVTNLYLRVKYINSSGYTVYLTPSELKDYEFSLYTIKPATNNVNVITGEVTDEFKKTASNGGGVIKFEIPKVCTNRFGIVKCEIHINQGNKKIASSTFVLDVKQSLVTEFDDSLLEDSDFPVLKQLILEVQNANNIDDNNRSKTTSYSSDKIETIKEDLTSQINTIGEGITSTQTQQLSVAYNHSQSTHAPSNAEANVQVDWNETNTRSDSYIKNKPTNLARIDDIPTVPTKTSQLTNDSGYITNVPDEYITETELNAKGYVTTSQMPTVPTNVSAFTNDANYASETFVQNKITEASLSGGEVDLSGYVTKGVGNASQIQFTDGETFQAKLEAGTLKGEKGDRGEQGIQGPKGDKGDPGELGASIIDDTTASATTTYSSNKIKTIKEGLTSQINAIKNNISSGNVDLGLVCDGTTDNTAKLQEIVNQYNYIELPAGSIYLASTVRLDSNRIIIGMPTTKIITNGNPAFYCETLRDSSNPDAAFKENVYISNICFESKTYNQYSFIQCRGANNIIIEKCKAYSMGLVQFHSTYTFTDAPRDDGDDPLKYSGIRGDNDLNTNIFILDNYIADNPNGASIKVSYGKNVVVNNNIIEHAYDGISFWGGTISGVNQADLTYYSKNITVSNNVMEDMITGGIWSVRTESITASNNVIKRCGDVGLDYEGTLHGVGTGNVIYDCKNGCLATLYNSQKILFEGNVCADTGYYPDSKFIFAHSHDINKKTEIDFRGNTFHAKTRVVGTDIQSSMEGKINIQDNTFYNAKISFDNSTYTAIKGNSFWVDPALNADEGLVEIYGMTNASNGVEGIYRYCYEIVGNNFRNSTKDALNDSALITKAICISASRWRQNFRVLIKDNEITGFNHPISVKTTDTNASDQSIIYLELIDNILSGDIDNASINDYFSIYCSGNKKMLEPTTSEFHSVALSNYPNAIPTATYYTGGGSNVDNIVWLAGTKIYFDKPDTDGYTGAICTVSGNPGTWKRFGKIEQ